MIWKHNKKVESADETAGVQSKDVSVTSATLSTEQTAKKTEPKDASPEALRELLEKNLKWSQIIYEQNRKINGKLFWYAFSGWLRVFLILVPLVLAVWFLPPLLKNMLGQYQEIMGGLLGAPGGNKSAVGALKDVSPSSLEQLLKILPLNSAQQEQLKTILK